MRARYGRNDITRQFNSRSKGNIVRCQKITAQLICTRTALCDLGAANVPIRGCREIGIIGDNHISGRCDARIEGQRIAGKLKITAKVGCAIELGEARSRFLLKTCGLKRRRECHIIR